MILCRILGTVVQPIQHKVYDGRTILICQPVRANGRSPLGVSFLAVDSVQAGEGDLVLAAREGNAARQILGGDDDPFHAVVLGIVDEVSTGSAAGS